MTDTAPTPAPAAHPGRLPDVPSHHVTSLDALFFARQIIALVRAEAPYNRTAPQPVFVFQGKPMTLRQLGVLALIATQPDQCGPANMARTLGLQKPIVTRAHVNLAARGLVVARPDRSDGRRTRLFPTEQGAAAVREAALAFAQHSTHPNT